MTWSCYCELLDVGDYEKRTFYERKAANAGWYVRELCRQMSNLLFECVLSAKGGAWRGPSTASNSEKSKIF